MGKCIKCGKQSGEMERTFALVDKNDDGKTALDYIEKRSKDP